ncbi:unnamed protein product [Musa acuminata var. zebrina]
METMGNFKGFESYVFFCFHDINPTNMIVRAYQHETDYFEIYRTFSLPPAKTGRFYMNTPRPSHCSFTLQATTTATDETSASCAKGLALSEQVVSPRHTGDRSRHHEPPAANPGHDCD